MPFAKYKCADQPARMRSLICTIGIRCLDFKKPKFTKVVWNHHSCFFVDEQPGLSSFLCLSLSQSSQTFFLWRAYLVMRFVFYIGHGIRVSRQFILS